MSNTTSLSAEQIQYVMNLPKRTMIVGGKEQTLACDMERRKVFFLDPNGRPTGRVVKMDDNVYSTLRRDIGRPAARAGTNEVPPKETGSPEDEPQNPTFSKKEEKKRGGLGDRLRKLAGASDEEIASSKGKGPALEPDPVSDDTEDDALDDEDNLEEPEAPTKKRKKSKKPLIAAIAVGLIVFAALFASSHLRPIQSTNGIGAIVGGPSSSLSTIDVIQVTRDFIPGDTITENDIQKATISAETYNQISLNGTTLYQWSRSDSLLNAYAASFIPKGQYLTYENVDSIYHQAVNPWASESGDVAYITLPLTTELVQDGSIGYGSILDLTITRTTTKTTPASTSDGEDAEEAPSIPGLEHQATVEQSSVVETYGLSNVVVSDLMNNDKNSLYSTYSTWISIPAGERSVYLNERLSEDSTLGSTMLPTYVQISVTKAQAEALGDLTASDVEVTINVTDNVDTSNDAKSIFSAESKAFIESVRAAMQEVSSSAEN